jgi:hypothetical protein
VSTRLGEWLGLAFVVTAVFVLVRPQSKAAVLVDALGKFLVALVRRATDLA